MEITAPKPKRRKIQLACKICRNSKSRCDGLRPICSSCQKRGLTDTCIYERPQLLAPDKDSQAVRPPSTSFRPDNSHPDTANPTRDNLDQDYYQLDALATVSSGNNDDCLYGGSSTIAFVQQLSQPSEQHAPRAGGRVTYPKPTRLLESSESASVYPARRKADDFLYCFWEFIHPVFPVLHKTSFITKYERLWSSISTSADEAPDQENEEEEVLFSACLNLTFALGCQFSTLVQVSQKKSAADDFYQRARQLYVFDILDSRSFTSVQMLLLTAIYLQSTPHANRCWNSIGLAVRLAQSQGLHLDSPGRKPESQLATQMRRRVWHTCVVLDILSAMTYGRPTMLTSASTVPIPVAVDDEYLAIEGDGTQPSDTPSCLGLFVSTCHLFQILREILSTFYAGTMLADVLNYNRRLDMFNDTVPRYLHVVASSHVSAPDKSNGLNLQQQILFCRFLYTKLLSLRPLLLLARSTKSLDQSRSTAGDARTPSLDDELISSCCNSCIRTALNLVDTIYQNLDTAYRSSGWHSVYFTFAAATILLAGWTSQGLDLRIHQESFEKCWQKCLSILNHYKEQIHSAPRAIQVLQSIRNHALGTHSQNPLPNESGGAAATVSVDTSWLFELSQFNAAGADRISDAWFGQQLSNVDWLDIPLGADLSF